MFEPTKKDWDNCVKIVKEITKISDIEACRKHADEIFQIAYSIGGSYEAKTLKKIAEAILINYK